MSDRFEKLDEWLEQNNCHLYLVNGGDEVDLEYWTYPGGTGFIVMRTDTGWELFTPASSTKKVEETLREAELQLSGKEEL